MLLSKKIKSSHRMPLPCHKLGSYHFSPSTHICSQGGNDESILSLFLGFLRYILRNTLGKRLHLPKKNKYEEIQK
nr:hypothetical protein Iba_chr02eCG1500 [Ipomoea batatas]